MIYLIFVNFILLVCCIGLIDYTIFYKYSICPHCKKRNANTYSWIPATVLELLLFFSGMALGLFINIL